MKRALILSGLVVVLLGAAALAYSAQAPAPKAENDQVAACAAMMSSEGGTAEGRAAMEQFMRSDKMAAAMNGMMVMARQMGNGDPMAGTVRMMEMMASMGRMGVQMDGMMGPAQPTPSQ